MQVVTVCPDCFVIDVSTGKAKAQDFLLKAHQGFRLKAHHDQSAPGSTWHKEHLLCCQVDLTNIKSTTIIKLKDPSMSSQSYDLNVRARMLEKIKTDDNFCGDQLESGHFLLYHKV